MKIMVFDVPAESGGALTILEQYYEKALLDQNNEWFFILSTPQLKSKKNVEVLSFPWVKKSWFHRLYFDVVIAPKLSKKYQIDEILSLQNVIIPRVNIKQTLYLHQPLPFSDVRYKISENFKFWMYQNIISNIIYRSVKNADKVIVQTKWMIDSAIKKTGVSKNKFILEPPIINAEDIRKYSPEKSESILFFYPSSSVEYKNHRIILETCKLLNKKKINNYKVVLTLKGNENSEIISIYNTSMSLNLPLEFAGSMTQEEVYSYYSKSTLLFPSYIETFGLPLLEAKMHNSPIIASRTPFALEILENYTKVEFFNPFDAQELAVKMNNMIEKVSYLKRK